MAEANVVVLGAGVIGLTTALLLSEDATKRITVVAKHMPGDYDIEYASPWAGANYVPISKAGTAHEEYERNTWPFLQHLASDVPEAGIHFQDNSEYFRKKDVNTVTGQWVQEKMKKDPWFSGVVPNFRTVPADELPPGIDSATRFTSVCINTAIYLPWLVSQCLKSGVVFRRVIVGHVSEAAERHQLTEKVDVVVNCTGLSSARLGGVQDSSVIPARGQIVLVRNDPGVMCGTSGTDDGSDEVTYIMHRAAGGGCILGGCYQKGDWESQPDPNLAIRIMRRCVELCPSLTGGKGIEGLSIIRHGVGLRPLREKGPRIEKEKVQGTWVVHHYGHGGYGYQASYGSAKAAVRLIEEVLDGKGPRSRL